MAFEELHPRDRWIGEPYKPPPHRFLDVTQTIVNGKLLRQQVKRGRIIWRNKWTATNPNSQS